ncbi:MAG TPA: hypothetical protein VD968_16195 [Pyrinomonadaceae bacterium]|nr:hypothetical protein [Pyrinomonadaceae bacterium]
MATAPAAEERGTETEEVRPGGGLAARLAGLARAAFVRELLIFLAFCLLTALLTWPYVTRMRDAVADPGDPYLVAWILWWDYHQTFTDPLNLFHSNVFYPYRYTLAFSEHNYGLALPFFPLFALGLRPLTVHAVALYFGFALCGYGAFRLARTLTGSTGAAWVAGIIFAFIPYRFHLLSHLPYLFSPWVPLLFEAFVLFARERSRRRAAWLGFALFATGLTTVSWFALSLVPLALSAAILLTRHGLWRERAFWRRGAAAAGGAALGLLPFMLPYYIASKLYGFKRNVWEIQANSAWPVHWLSAENRNKFWHGMGEAIPGGGQFKLFPGLLPVLLSLAAVLIVEPARAITRSLASAAAAKAKWVGRLDTLIVVSLVLSVFAVGFHGTAFWWGVFNYVTSERVLAVLTVAVIARLCLAYPPFFLRLSEHENLVETIRSPRRTDAFWLGAVWCVVGFCYSLGWNFFFYRILYDLIPLFRSMRVPTRGAMICYMGLAVLAGLGTVRLAELIRERRPRVREWAVFAAACALLLIELNGAPLKFMRGDVFPDSVTLRLKETPMTGGIVALPAGGDYNHRHILRAADHAKPLVNGTSGFNPPYEDQIEWLTRGGTIQLQFMELLEKIPASYLVVQTHLVPPERRADYETFLARGVASGRLRFINRFDGRDDLYAVTRNEPDAQSEAALPFGLSIREWAALVEDDPVNMLGQYQEASQTLFRLHVAATGRLPRYAEFLNDLKAVGSGVIAGFEEDDRRLEANMRELAESLTRRPDFREAFAGLDEAQFVDRLLANAGLQTGDAERAALVEALRSGAVTRGGALLKVAEDPRFVERERNRSLVVLHYFGYFRRNPDDPPDTGMFGVNFWVEDLERNNNPSKLSAAFMNSIEYQQKKAADKK